MLGTIIGLPRAIGIVFRRLRVVRAERYSAHGGGDDYEESHEDDPNDPPPRPVPRHPFVDVLVLVRRFFFIIVAQGTRAIAKGGYALFRMLRFTGSKEGGWGVDTHLFPCSCGTIRRGQKAVFMARKLEAVADSKAHGESPLGLWKQWEELVSGVGEQLEAILVVDLDVPGTSACCRLLSASWAIIDHQTSNLIQRR